MSLVSMPSQTRANTRNDPVRRAAKAIVSDAARTQRDPGAVLAACIADVVSERVTMPKWMASPAVLGAREKQSKTHAYTCTRGAFIEAWNAFREPALAADTPSATHRALFIGRLHECVLAEHSGLQTQSNQAGEASVDKRRARGAFYTPAPLAGFVLDQALADLREQPDAVICDPACGGGAFLIGTLEQLNRNRRPVTRSSLLAHVAGVDLDPLAAWIATVAMWVWCDDADLRFQAARDRIHVGDALLGCVPRDEPGSCAFRWTDAFPEVFKRDCPGFDAIVGNPPFLGQMNTATARDRDAAAEVRRASNGVVTRYADTAAAFWELSTRLTRPGGRLSLVLPLPILAARDSAAVRGEIARRCELESLWTCDTRMFADANVRVCVPTARVYQKTHKHSHDATYTVRRFEGQRFTTCPPVDITTRQLQAAPSWAGLLSSCDVAGSGSGLSIVIASTPDAPVVGNVAHAAADFRDEYYALRGLIADHPSPEALLNSDDTRAPVPIITCGLIDPSEHRWGRCTTRIHKERWNAPAISREDLASSSVLRAFARKRLVPKLLIATQTRVIEAVADPAGRLLPSTPVLSLAPKDPEHLWLLLSAMLSPVCSWIALTRTKGSALSPDAIKLSASQLASLPLPGDPARPDQTWRDAAHAVRMATAATTDQERRIHLDINAHAMTTCYGLTGDPGKELIGWWRSRLRVRPPTQIANAAHPEHVSDVGSQAA
jgi:hypothetical protein